MPRWTIQVLSLMAAAVAGCDGCAGCGTSGEEVAELSVMAHQEAALEALDARVPDAARAPESKYPADAKACARMLVVAHEGVARGAVKSSRSKDEARGRAEALRRRIVEDGESFVEVARAASETTDRIGGALGVRTYGEWPFMSIRDAVFDLDEGDVTPVLDTERGFVLAWRCPAKEVDVQHILIRYRGAGGDFEARVRRSKKQARALAERLLEEVRAGADIAELAREHSDGEATDPRGREYARITAAFPIAAMETAALALEPGEVSDVVESPYGFHILQRLPD
jgi:peptidyl-prolyl cis-trans isomerase NIMA-interacting 1